MKIKSMLAIFILCSLTGSRNSVPKKSEKPAASPADKIAQAVIPPQVENEKPPDTATSFKPFYIFNDKGSALNHYIPSGFMPDGKCIAFNDAWLESCHDGKSCIKIAYDVECSRLGAKWAGVYWQNPANNWGNRKGGFNLTGANKLTFWAKGDKGGERIEEIKVGGLTGDYPDSDTAVIGPIILTPEWKQYSIDLRGKDLTYISGGLAWSTNVDVNPQTCIFYLDDIRFE